MSSHDYTTAELRRSLRLITAGVCLCVLYLPVTSSPIFTAYIKDLGATAFHFGLITGIPMIMFALQFVAAFMNNRMSYRKRTFMICNILSRFLYIPIALIPWLCPSMIGSHWILAIIILIALSAALNNMAVPIWFGWMADLIPSRILGRYWGNRQRWMFVFWTAGYIATALYAYYTDWPLRLSFPILAIVCVSLGITDIMLFLKVPEPANSKLMDVSALHVLLEPFRHKEFKNFVAWSAIKAFSMMFGGTFMQVYALSVLKMPVWQATVAWCVLGVGSAFSSRYWGLVADRHGQRPVLIIAMCGKPLVTLVFLFLTPEQPFLHSPAGFSLTAF